VRFIFHRLAFQKFNFAIEVGNLLVNGPTKRNPNPKWSNLVMTREATDLKETLTNCRGQYISAQHASKVVLLLPT